MPGCSYYADLLTHSGDLSLPRTVHTRQALPPVRLSQTAAAGAAAAQTSETPRMKKFLVYRWVSDVICFVVVHVCTCTGCEKRTTALRYQAALFPPCKVGMRLPYSGEFSPGVKFHHFCQWLQVVNLDESCYCHLCQVNNVGS